VRRGGGDDDGALADLEAAEAVVDGEAYTRQLGLDAGDDRVHDLEGHRRVGLVLEVVDLLALAAAADVADKNVGAARARVTHRRERLIELKRLVLEARGGAVVAVVAAADRGDEGDLDALAELGALTDELVIDGETRGTELAFELGVGARDLIKQLGGGGARGRVDLEVITAETLPQAGEEEDRELHEGSAGSVRGGLADARRQGKFMHDRGSITSRIQNFFGGASAQICSGPRDGASPPLRSFAEIVRMMQTSLHEFAVSRAERTPMKGPRAAAVQPAFDRVDDALDAPCGADEADEIAEELVCGEREALRSLLQQRLAAYLAGGRPRVILTDNLRTMLSIKKGQGLLTFRVHHMFAEAPPVVLRALARYAESHDREAAAVLRAFVDGNEHRIRRITTPRPVAIDVQGAHHDLQALFDGLNARYFGDQISAKITWGQRGLRRPRRSSIKLGSYSVEEGLIRIHPVLDASDVPGFFVEWIVYHEMLHEVHDMPIVEGRRIYHTPAFRRAEAQYERYVEAVLWERTHLHKLLER